MFAAAYCTPFCESQKEEFERQCKEFVAAVSVFKPELLQKPKFHLLLHLPQSMEDFGPTMAFSIER